MEERTGLDWIVGRGWSFPLRIGPHGGIALSSEQAEIEESIRIILSTAKGERAMRLKFGSRLHELVFEPNNSQTAARARQYIEEALGMWEPRIRLVEVKVDTVNSARGSHLLFEIFYEIKTIHDVRSLVFPFYLIPGETGAG
jgi:phage baseplate assembly protein W